MIFTETRYGLICGVGIAVDDSDYVYATGYTYSWIAGKDCATVKFYPVREAKFEETLRER
jgi:hypothetical protein